MVTAQQRKSAVVAVAVAVPCALCLVHYDDLLLDLLKVDVISLLAITIADRRHDLNGKRRD